MGKQQRKTVAEGQTIRRFWQSLSSGANIDRVEVLKRESGLAVTPD